MIHRASIERDCGWSDAGVCVYLNCYRTRPCSDPDEAPASSPDPEAPTIREPEL